MTKTYVFVGFAFCELYSFSQSNLNFFSKMYFFLLCSFQADMVTNVDDIVSLGKSTEDDTELKDNYEDVIQTDLGNNDEKPDVVDVDNIESSSGSDDIDLTGIPVNYFF